MGKTSLYRVRTRCAALLLASSTILLTTQASTGPASQPVARCGGFLEGIVVDAREAIWVLDVVGGSIFQVDEYGKCTERGRTGGMPNGAKFAPDGTLTIADQSGLFSFDPATGKLIRLSFAYEGRELRGLNDLGYDRAGGLYISVPGRSDAIRRTGQVFYRSVDGQVRLLADGLAYPNGIAVAPDGEIVAVAEFAAKRILSLPSVNGRKPLRMAHIFAYTQGGVGPDGILFDRNGRLITANLGDGTIHVFGRDGRLQHIVPLGAKAGSMPTNLAFDGRGLLVSEAERGEIWRIELPLDGGPPPPGDS